MLVTTRRGVLIGRRRGEVGGYKNEETRKRTISAAGGLITGSIEKRVQKRMALSIQQPALGFLILTIPILAINSASVKRMVSLSDHLLRPCVWLADRGRDHRMNGERQ